VPRPHSTSCWPSTVSTPSRSAAASTAGRSGGYSAVGRTSPEEREVEGADVAEALGQVARQEVVRRGVAHLGHLRVDDERVRHPHPEGGEADGGQRPPPPAIGGHGRGGGREVRRCGRPHHRPPAHRRIVGSPPRPSVRAPGLHGRWRGCTVGGGAAPTMPDVPAAPLRSAPRRWGSRPAGAASPTAGRWWLPAIVLVGVALRVAWALHATRPPVGLHDPTFYTVFADRLAGGPRLHRARRRTHRLLPRGLPRRPRRGLLAGRPHAAPRRPHGAWSSA
jgi:hypothetical protein